MKLTSLVRLGGLLALLACGLPAPLAAQQTESRIVGRLVDDSKAALPGVTVTVTSKQTGAVRTVVTDADGSYVVTSLSPSVYTLQFELTSFATQAREVVPRSRRRQDRRRHARRWGRDRAGHGDRRLHRRWTCRSAKIGVNVSPEEVENLPVNGRNFANLMTLAPGATSDGNGGWASVRFNGKSNQQNYLNYDGVDGTYVWDASPGYLNATGSQFRLQTSMESVAEFRVNSGLAPAESGLGAGGNITVVSKSGGNNLRGSVFEYFRDDALDSASKYDDKKQELSLNQFGGSIGGPIVRNRTFIFGSFEGLRQTTGLSFTEAVPSDAARARVLAGQPIGSGAGQSPARTQAVAPLLAGFPLGTVATANPLLALASQTTEATQEENSVSLRVDHMVNSSNTLYVRYLYSKGEVDTPDRTVTPRRVLAKQQPQNVVANYQALLGSTMVNEFKVGLNLPETSAIAFGTAGLRPHRGLAVGDRHVAVDRRPRHHRHRAQRPADSRHQRVVDHRLDLRPALAVLQQQPHLVQGRAHGEVRRRVPHAAVGLPVPGQQRDHLQQHHGLHRQQAQRGRRGAGLARIQAAAGTYLIGFAQDSWRLNDKLTLELGLRYDFYSVVKERDGQAKPFFVEDNDFSSDVDNFYDADKNNFAPRLSAAYQIDPKTVVRAGFGLFYGPGQFEDRIQPIENAIERRRVGAADVPNNGLAYPVPPSTAAQHALDPRLHAPPARRVQHAVRRERVARAARRDQPERGLHRQPRQGHVPAWRRQHPAADHATRPTPSVGQVDYKTSGCLDGLVINGFPISGCGRASYDALQVGLSRRFRGGFTGGLQYQYSRNKGTTQGSNEAATTQNTFDYETEYGTNPQDIPHTFNGSLVYQLPGEGFWTGGWRVGGIVNARSGVPINVTINRPDNITVTGATVVNIPGGNSRGTQRPDLVPGVDPYLKDGVRWLNPAAFATPQPGTFGNLPRNFLRGPQFWQADLMFSKDFRFMQTQGVQVRLEMFNIANRLNYENPAASLPNGVPGAAFTDAQAGTFGYMLGPLNRTVGQGTARQTQISIRYTF